MVIGSNVIHISFFTSGLIAQISPAFRINLISRNLSACLCCGAGWNCNPVMEKLTVNA